MVYTLSLRLRELIGEMFVLRKERIAREDQLRYEAEEAVCSSLSSLLSLLLLTKRESEYRHWQRRKRERKLLQRVSRDGVWDSRRK